MKSKQKHSNRSKARWWPTYKYKYKYKYIKHIQVLERVLNLSEAYHTHMRAKMFDYPAIIGIMK